MFDQFPSIGQAQSDMKQFGGVCVNAVGRYARGFGKL